MRKAEVIRKELKKNYADSPMELIAELMLDIRNTLIQIHIGKNSSVEK